MLESLRFLQSAAGINLLAELQTADPQALSDTNTLKLLTGLRKRYSPDNAAAALETARVRIRARDKFPAEIANRLFSTREALEQATPWLVSELVHRQFLSGFDLLADLGCSIGSDTLALAKNSRVIGVDRDPLRLTMARSNIKSPRVEFVQADLSNPLPMSGVRAAFFDPARRTPDKRVFSVRDYSPSLEIIKRWNFDALLIKLSPGVDLAELTPYGGDIHFVSVDGELKEGLLCIGPGKIAGATIIAGDAHQPEPIFASDSPIDAPPMREPQGYLYEPDPAIIRAGLLGELAQRLGLSMYRLDETIAYLTADSLVRSPLARAWIIDDWMPFNLKKLRAYLRERGVGRVTIKKRGSPITPEELIARLKLPGGGHERVVVLTRVLDQPAILVCRALENSD